RACQSAISIRYPLVEILTGLLCGLVAWRFHLELGGGIASCIFLLVLFCGLLVAAFIDAELRILPDEITVGGMHLLPPAMLVFQDLRWAPRAGAPRELLAWRSASLPSWDVSTGAALAILCVVALLFFAAGCLLYRRYRSWRLPGEANGFFSVSLAGLLSGLSAGLGVAVCLLPAFEGSVPAYNLASSLLGMLTGSALVFIIGVVGTLVFRKPAMGFGDVKLMGLLGALTGCWGAVSAFFLACILGSIVGIPRRLISGDRHLAFGPFLMIAGVFVYLWRDAVDLALQWYMGLFSV
ncbi:MAG: prepilin peptidase, partial [Planctomycetota bacterium]|nr:prepilin peptidase [Planctomycetota bacterium]